MRFGMWNSVPNINKIADPRGDWLVTSVTIVHIWLPNVCRDAVHQSQILIVLGMLKGCLYFGT